MSVVKTNEGKVVEKTDYFEVSEHPQSKRLFHIDINKDVLEQFFREVKDVSVQQLEYVPYMRFIIADQLNTLAGSKLKQVLTDILYDRETGGYTIGTKNLTSDPDDYVKFSTAITHLIGEPNFDSMSGKYYARFTVQHEDNSDSYLRQPYRLFTLHTDGTFVDEPTDWLLMMKMKEENAVGGESRLLHLDDWDELDTYLNHPLATKEITYKAPSSKNVNKEVNRTTFFKQNNKPCICFIDQFAYPKSVEEASYLKGLSESMENDSALIELKLPVGDLVVLNNAFWLHGRAAFEKNPELNRELLRQRGSFLS
ncbi:glutarate dioxygenase GlaH [Alteribacter keqinensis]|uniref:Carbon starvation induced protein CsiD n=1 Tax=Alteribacter keqinensis TaxID=2483800 RepID=A0A3M7TL14_9BACI|nr:glutarate dioxygenase GlaH [Alteribacter keqinensis]RNA66227.1 carbon starvation induced protein CsiD [Alteribacter keqinensis]